MVLDPSCVLYVPLWKRDGKQQIVSDDMYGRLGSVTGSLFTSQGRYFNGGDMVTFNNSQPLTGESTFLIWFKLVSWTDYRRVFDQAIDADHEFVLYLNNDDRFTFAFQSDVGVYPISLSSPAYGKDDLFHFLAFTISPKDGEAVLYTDMRHKNVDNSISGLIDLSSAPFILGAASSRADVVIGEYAQFNRILKFGEMGNYYEDSKFIFV